MELMLRPDPVGAVYNHAAPEPENSRAAGPVLAEGAAGCESAGWEDAGEAAGWAAAFAPIVG